MTLNIFIMYLFIFLCVKQIICTEKKYNNYTLFRGIPVSNSHLNFFRNLSSLYDVDYWRGPGEHLYRPIEFLIKPDNKTHFLRIAEQNEVYLTTIMEDVQSAFDLQTVKSYIRRNVDSFNWHSFYRLKDIYDWLGDLSNMHPREMTIESIGKTYGGQDILAVRIVLKGSKLRSKVIVEGGIHAREWIAPSFVTYMLHQILNAADSHDNNLRTIAETYEWYFVPILNPDGYEITFGKDRLWRKNRNGVDLNRNFGISFGTVGVSHNPRSEIYCGKSAFSEPETKAMANFIKKNSIDLEYYLAFHSYGQFMVLPFAHSRNHLGNFNEVKKMCDEAASEIFHRYKTPYSSGTAYDTVDWKVKCVPEPFGLATNSTINPHWSIVVKNASGYMTSGVSGCWTKLNFNVPYVVTFELRDDGRHGFALPPKQILPTCKETMDGVLSLLRPRSTMYKLRDKKFNSGGQEKTFLDVIVFVWNVVLFIIVRY